MSSNEKIVQNNIIIYYKCLQKHKLEWDNNVEKLGPYLNALWNQCEQLNAVLKFEIEGSEFEAFENLQERLIDSLSRGIEEEITNIEKMISVLNISCQDLKLKTTKLENSTLTLDWHESNFLIKGSVLQRPLSEILDWAYRVMQSYTKSMANIYEVYKKLNYKNVETIQELKNVINKKENNYENEALMYLQFCEQVKIE